MVITIIFVIITIILFLFYFRLGYSVLFAPSLNNSVLNLISSQQSWKYNAIPYSFKITSSDVSKGIGALQIAYFDNLGGYLQGMVIFNATYQILDNKHIQINPTTLVSSATKRWPQNQVWKLNFVNMSSLILNTDQNTYNLIPY